MTMMQRAVTATKRWVLRTVALVIALALLFMVTMYYWSYSNGDRAGWVLKFSKKGWVCKTWEGEMTMAAMPVVVPERFQFTVRDDAIAEKLNRSLGKRVVVSYEQHIGLPGCFGDTEYFVKDVTEVPEAGSPAPVPTTTSAGSQVAPAGP